MGHLRLVVCLLMVMRPVAALELLTEEYPPYNMSLAPGHAGGLSTEIVSLLMQQAGVPYRISVMPWARAILLARTRSDTCVFSMSRTPEREADYRWIGPLVYNDWTLFAAANAARPATLEAARPYRIGSYLGDAIVPWLQERGFRVDAAPGDDTNPDKLLAGHIDFWATGKLIGLYRLKKAGLQERIVPVLDFNRTAMYLACGKGMAEDTEKRLNQQLAAMVRAGRVARIYQQYGYVP